MSLIHEYLLHFSKSWISSSILLQLQRERISFHREGWALLNHETPRHRNSKTAIFLQLFFLNTESHKETNSADIGSQAVEKFMASAKRVSRRGCLDVQ